MGSRHLPFAFAVFCFYISIVAAALLQENGSHAKSSGAVGETRRPNKDDEDEDDDEKRSSAKWPFIVLGVVAAVGAFVAVFVICVRCAPCPMHKWWQRKRAKTQGATAEAVHPRVVMVPNAPTYDQPPKYERSYYNGPPAQAQQEVPYYNTFPVQKLQPPPYYSPTYPQGPMQQHTEAPYYETVPPPNPQGLVHPRDNAANCPIYETPYYQESKT